MEVVCKQMVIEVFGLDREWNLDNILSEKRRGFFEELKYFNVGQRKKDY